MENLITLCNSCHDFVEINGIQDININSTKTITIKEEIKNIDWHKWVYGGYRKP